MKDQAPNPLESLQLIDSMINKARNRFTENGHLYLLWGWVVFICSLGHYLLQYVFHYPQFYLVWMLTWAALVYQFFYIAKRKRKATVITYTDEIIKYVWLVFGVCSLLLVLVTSRFMKDSNDMNAIILVLYGMPTLLSGAILKFKPLMVGAVFCWLLAITTLFIPSQYYQLLITAAVVVAWIVPGYLLQARYKKHQN